VINRWLRREWIESITNSHIISLTWIYCPGHAGVRGNEIADRLAGKAAVNDVIEMNKSDLQTAIRQELQLQKTNEFKQSAYYKRFEELHITEGSGKLLGLFGRSRAIYNQNAIGIITTPTLREILRLRAYGSVPSVMTQLSRTGNRGRLPFFTYLNTHTHQ
jgi:hypothetical protein